MLRFIDLFPSPHGKTCREQRARVWVLPIISILSIQDCERTTAGRIPANTVYYHGVLGHWTEQQRGVSQHLVRGTGLLGSFAGNAMNV